MARHLATLLPTSDGATAAEVVARIDRLAARAEAHCRTLGPARPDAMVRRRDGRPLAEHVTDRRLTSDAILDQEVTLQEWAEREAAPTQPPTADPQAAAASAMAGDATLVVVVGPAGTGKTTATAKAVRNLHTASRPVVGLAPSGKAADVLAVEAGCPTHTLAGFLTRHRSSSRSPWPPGTTVVLDEAGMATTDNLAHLVDLVRRNRWRLVAVGDPAQLPAVGRGGVFAHWCATVSHHHLTVPRRFDQAWEAAASLGLRAGDPGAAEAYADHGRLLTAHPALVARNVAESHQLHSRAGRTVVITTNTVETARAVNTEIQRIIDPARRRARLCLADGTHVSVGDQVATRRNEPTLRTDQGKQVRNRHTWAVTGLDRTGGLTVFHPERGTVMLPAAYVDRHVELGWAVTGYGNQGDTVDVGLAVLEPGTTRNHAYVALTRGRAVNRAWVPDPTGTLDPADQLAGMIGRTPDHDSALATHARLHVEAGTTISNLTLRTTMPTSSRAPDGPMPPDRTASDPTLDERVAAMQARLDHLQESRPPRVGRPLGR